LQHFTLEHQVGAMLQVYERALTKRNARVKRS